MNKVIYHNFQYYETDEIEYYLEKMAAKGYMLTKMSESFMTFSHLSVAQDKYKYQVNYDTNRNVDEIIEKMKSDGWEFVYHTRYFIIFRTVKDIEVSKDMVFEEKKFETIQKIRRNKELILGCLFAFIAALCCYLNIVIMKRCGFTIFSKEFLEQSFAFLIGVAISQVFLIYYISELYDYIVWNKAAKRNLERNIPIKYRRTKFKRIIFSFASLCEVITVFLSIVAGIYILFNTKSGILLSYTIFTWVILLISGLLHKIRMKGSFVYLAYLAIIAFAISSMVMSFVYLYGV